MTNLYEITPSNDDDEPSSVSAAELDADTSFEIDEPDDEEVLDSHMADVQNSNVTDAALAATAAAEAAAISIDEALRLVMINGKTATARRRQSLDVLTNNATPTNRSTHGDSSSSDSDGSDCDDSRNSNGAEARTPTHRKACEDCAAASVVLHPHPHQPQHQHQHQHHHTVPFVTVRADCVDGIAPTATTEAYGDDSGDEQQTDTSETVDDDDSNTASSTPTTADVADVSNAKRLTALQQHGKLTAATTASATASPGFAHLNVGAESDNLSASIATTTTEVDLDGIASVSPMTTARLLAGRNIQSPQHSGLVASNTLAPMRATRTTTTTTTLHNEKRQHEDGQYDDDEPEETAVEAAQRRADLLHHKRTQSASSYRSIRSNGAVSLHAAQSLPAVQALSPNHGIYFWLQRLCQIFKSSGIGEPSVYHAVIVIFLEFFAWGLLAMPVISVLNQTFPDHTFLMNGLVMGIKGILSFLSAPLVGALSDIWGRKFFLLITVFFTCAPIPLMTINSWWFFAMISISGVFAVTFSVVFAYVADVTTVEERSRAYGLVSATFAASLVISPALGALLREKYSDTLVVALATAIAVLDVFFILVAVPESLPEKMRPQSWGTPISWEQADPFSALRKVGTDRTILMQCFTVLLSYLPEAGQYSCIFVYLKLKMGFNSMEVAIFIAVVGILSISVQVILGYLMRVLGGKRTIIFGLILEMIQLLWYGFGSQAWMMWSAGILAAIASITYPAISAFVSLHSTADSQGVVQGIITGMRGLCNGLGPAMFGVIFYFFNVDLNGEDGRVDATSNAESVSRHTASLVPGPPFAIGAILVVLAIVVAIFIPDGHGETILSRAPSEKKRPSKDQYTLAQL